MHFIDDDGFRVPLTEEDGGLWRDPSGYLYRIFGDTATRLYDGLDTADTFAVESW